MLVVKVNENQFDYDIHSLVKAFFPETDVKVLSPEAESELYSDENLPCISIFFGKTEISVEIKSKSVVKSEKFEVKEVKEVKEADSEKIFSDKISIEKDYDRPMIKNQLKQVLYKSLTSFTGKRLPWGNLTGIRPTKIPMLLLEQGKSDDEILKYMKDVYDITDEKGLLSIDIAKREKELLSTIHYKDGYSLYIGIPFCPTTCLYCSFTSYPISMWKKRMNDYLTALEKEIEFVADKMKDKILDSIYVGGGTPTTLEAEELDRLLKKVSDLFDLSHIKEYTVEAGRADSITREKLKVLKKYNITRISVNPQTMKDETLKLIGRHHTVDQVREAFQIAREEGFTNINMDIILGLPGETVEDVTYTMKEITKLQPDSLTVHSLAIKRASKMNQWIEENGVTTMNNTEETMKIAEKAAKDMGMEPYYLYRQKNMSGNFENVGYATKGNYGVYNILIMEEKQTIVALGAGSITKVVYEDGRIERTDNVKDVEQYITRIDEMLARKEVLLSV